MTSPLPTDEQLMLNPHAPHPPFAWYVSIPSTWALLDTNPTSWQRNAARLVDDRFAGRSLKAADRRAVLGFLEQLVADCQRAGAALSMIQLGRMSTGAVGGAGLHLAWYDSEHEQASLAMVRQSLPRSGTVDEVSTPAGPALLHTERASIIPPGATARVQSRVLQLYLPLVGTTWTAVLSAATPHPEMEPVLGEIVVAVARSIQPVVLAEAAEPDPSDDFEAVPPVDAPGIEKGFGTLLRRRVDGSTDHE